MKKLKVILPAILTLAVSTSAAVTGTVAWFTATRLRTIGMDQITAVNPEQGLNLLSLTGGNNVKMNYVGAEHGNVNVGGNSSSITHANVGDVQGYFRDASVDMSAATPIVYKANYNEENETITGYEPQTITTPDTKTFNGKNVYYATSFTATFGVNFEDTGYNYGLFFDFGSTITDPTGSTPDTNLYNAIRVGFKTTSNWFVWAPKSGESVGGASTKVAQYIHKEGEAAPAPKAHTNNDFVKTAASQTLNDSETPLSYTTYETTANGWLGNVVAGTAATAEANATGGTAVQIYTWFEGTDDDCISDNFTTALTGFKIDLRFVMRRVAKHPAP